MMKRGCEVILIKIKDIDYSKLKDYSYGTKLQVAESVPKYVDAIVTSETLDNLKERNLGKPILRPLIAK